MFLVPSCAILLWMSRRSCLVTQNSMRIGLVRSAMLVFASFKLQRTNFHGLGGTPEKIFPLIFQRTVSSKNLVPAQKKFPFHFTTDKFSAFVHSCAKFCCSLYNGHSFRRLAGTAGIKFPSRKAPLNLQRTLFRPNAGMAAKYF